MDDSLDCFVETVKVKNGLGIKRGTKKEENKRKKLSRTKKDSNNKCKDLTNPLSEITSNIVDNNVHDTGIAKVVHVSKYFTTMCNENCSGPTKKCSHTSDDEIPLVKKEEIISSENDKENCKPVAHEIKCEAKVWPSLAHDFAKPEEPKENMQLDCPCPEVIVEDNLEQGITFKKEIEDDSLECKKTEMNLMGHDDNEGTCSIPEPVAQNVECPVCNKMVEEHLHSKHVRDCFTNKFERDTGFCKLCGKDIAHMNPQRQLQHVNHCLDRQKQINQPGPNQFCPICGASFKTEDQRILHLKRCSRKLGIEPGKVVEASKLLEKQLAERKALGLPAVPLRANKTSPKKRCFAAVPQSNAEADMQMAMALSASMEKEDDWPLLGPPARGYRRKKVNRLPDCLLPLVLQTETNRLKLLEEKVAALIFPNVEECAVDKTERNFGDSKGDGTNLWTETATLETNFYLTELQDFITPNVLKSPLLDEHNPSEEIGVEVADRVEDDGSCSEKAEGFYAVESEINEGFGDTHRTLASDMKKLLGKPYLSDLMIHTSDGSVPAHKLILSARCPKALEPDDSIQELQWLDVSTATVFAFLECIYTGVFISKNAGDVQHQVLKLAYKYGAQELFHECQSVDVQRKDEVLLDKDEIQEICQFTQSQQHPSEVKPNSPTMSDIGIVDDLINEDEVEEVYMYMSQQQNAHSPNRPQIHGSEDEVPSIGRPSSPDLFDIGDDPISPVQECQDISKAKDIFDYSFSEALASSSPLKSLNKTFSENRICSFSSSFAKSPLKNLSELNAIQPRNESTCIRFNDSASKRMVLNSPEEVFHDTSSFENNIEATVQSLRQSLKLSSSPIKSSSEVTNTVGTRRLSILEKSLSPKHKLEPDLYGELSFTPLKNKRKRSLEDHEWKTPKRRSYEKQISPNLQQSFNQKENDSILLDDLDMWADFENECCVEMVDMPVMLKTSPGKIEGNTTMLKTSGKIEGNKLFREVCSDQHSDAQCSNYTGTHLSSLTQQDPVRVSGSQKIVTPKTKQILQKKVYDQVTPLPDYRKMITPELKEALKKYGVRKLPRSKAVILLNHIYELTHPWDEESDKPSTSKFLSPKIGLTQGKSPMQKVEIGKTSKLSKQKTKKSTVTSKVTRTRVNKDKTQAQQTCETKNKSQDELSSSQNSSFSDMPEESIGEAVAADSGMKESIRKYILENSELYENILLYEPIPVNDLHQELKHNKIAITMPQLMDFLDEECITFSLPRAANYKKKQQARSQRYRKKVLSKLASDS